MSQPFNNDFNNNSLNSSASDNQNVNNPEAELQQTAEDNAVEMESDNIENNDQEQPQDEEKRLEGEERSDEADADVNPSENQPEAASEEPSSSADNSDNDEKDEESDAPSNPVQDLPNEAASSGANENNWGGANASDQSLDDVSVINDKLFEEKIQRKINAVKSFAFCQKGDDEIPVFPYAVALTGHRSAVITDAVRETAKNQLRSLAKAWGSATSNCYNVLLNQTKYTRKHIKDKTVPLIALVGLEDGESGKIWAEIASELRDEEFFNIKVVAVASIQFKTLFELAEKHPDRFSRPDSNIDLNLIDGLIELPAGEEVNYLLDDYKMLESFCTDEKPHTRELFNMLLSNTNIYEIQLEEYRKFMCIHSHALIAFFNNIEPIQKRWDDIYADDLKVYTSSDSNNASADSNNELSESNIKRIQKVQNELSRYEDEVKNTYTLKDLIDQVYDIRQQGKEAVHYEDLKNQFEKLAEYHITTRSGKGNGQTDDAFTRTEEMIVQKLFGNIKAKLNPYQIPNGINFASVGPVVCIQTGNKTKPDSDKTSNARRSEVTIIVKDQPDDNEYALTKSFSFNRNIARFFEIKDVFKKLGLANKACLNNYKLYSKANNNYYSTNDNSDLQAVIDDDTDSLFKFSQYTRFLKSHYFHKMKNTMLLYASFALLLLFGIAVCSAYNSMNSVDNSSSPSFISIIPSILIIILIICQFFYSQLNYHKLYHYFHALFVGLKVQLYWDLAGVDENTPEMFNLHQIHETVWLRAAFNGLYVTLPIIKNAALTFDDSDSPEQQLKNYIDYNRKQLKKCMTIRENWVRSEFDDLIGKNKSSFDKFKDSLENELEELTKAFGKKTSKFSLENILILTKTFLNTLSPFGGKIACLVYLVPFIYFPIKNYILKTQTSDLNVYISDCCQSTVAKVIIAACFILLTFASCVLIVYNAYRQASLKDLDIKRKHQLLYPFRRANLLLNIKLAYWKHALQKLIENSNSSEEFSHSQENDSDDVDKYSHRHIINKSSREFKMILKDLGRIKLAVCAEWYLGLKERKMIIQYNRTFLR